MTKTPAHRFISETIPSFIYLATPYSSGDEMGSAGREKRYHAVTRAAIALQTAGLAVFSPITHSHAMATVFGFDREYEWWLNLDVAFLSKASALYVLMLNGWDTSPGVQFEIDWAIDHDLPIVYLDERMGLGPVDEKNGDYKEEGLSADKWLSFADRGATTKEATDLERAVARTS